MLTICKILQSGPLKDHFQVTRIMKGDIVGYDKRRSSLSIKIFRPTKKMPGRRLFFRDIKSDCSSAYTETYLRVSWMSKEQFKDFAECMIAAAGHEAREIDCGNLPVTWAFIAA